MAMPVSCRVCDLCFADDFKLIAHEREDTHAMLTWNCDENCGRAFQTQDQLVYHMLTAPLHHILANYKDKWGFEDGLRCEACDCSFQDVKSLYHHLKYLPKHNMAEEQLRPYGSGPRPSMQWVQAEMARLRQEEKPLAQLHPSDSGSGSDCDSNSSYESSTTGSNVSAGSLSTSSELLTLQREHNTVLEKMADLESELQEAKKSLEHEKSLRACPMCRFNEVDSVIVCGHQFCLECIKQWRGVHDNPLEAPCPACRQPMGWALKTYLSGSS